jgi:hypothetical protein
VLQSQAAIVMETLAMNALLLSQSTNVLRIHAMNALRNLNVNNQSVSLNLNANLSKLFTTRFQQSNQNFTPATSLKI